MAQYYQVNSLEDLHRLYPNLQIDNNEGVPCMIQEDQITQFTDGQGQQVIATVKPSGIQMPQNPNIPQQCATQQSQYVVHQPTQYVIQQVEATESQVPTVQYVQQTQQLPQNNAEGTENQFRDQSLNTIIPDFGREQVQSCIVKDDNSQQFISQVQPIQIQQQPIQIHQQIQGGNILVLQNQDQQNVLINQNKMQDLMPNQSQPENHLQQPQHIIIQRPSQQKNQIMAQRTPTIQKEVVAPQFIQHQILQNRRASQSGNPPQQEQQQQQQVINQQQPIIQQLHYYNQVTLIDNYSQPNVQSSEHSVTSNENVVHQQQILQSPGQQQYRPKKNPQQSNLPIIIQQPQQVLIPQISSPPTISTRPPQPRKKSDGEGSPAPVFILQKVESPFLVRQQQNKMRFQSPNQKVNESPYQTTAIQCEPNAENINHQNNQQVVQMQARVSPQTELQQQSVNMTGVNSKIFSDRTQSPGHFEVGISEQSFVLKTDQVNKPRAVGVPQIRPTMIKSKIDQQTETIEIKDMSAQQTEGFANTIQHQVSSPSSSPSQVQMSPQMQNQHQVAGRGRGARGAHPPQLSRTGQYVPRARGVQVQTSPPRQPLVEERRLKTSRGGIRGGRGGFVSCGQDQRQQTPIRPGAPSAQTTQTPKTGTTDQPAEEARMVVLLFNGEKKIVKIPVSQKNILLGQILQQAGIQIATPTPVSIEQVVDGSVEQFVIKNANTNSQQQATPLKTPGGAQTVSTPNSAGAPRSVVATVQQQRPRGPPAQMTQGSTVNIVRHRLQFSSPRATLMGSSNIRPEVGSQSSPSGQNSNLPHPAKEEPKFVRGYMAICPFCGISSLDFNKCIRCRRKLPENVKSQSIFHTKKKKLDKSTSDTEKNLEESKSESEDKLDSPDGKEKGSVQGYERKRPKPCLKKKKINDEPTEILILSSDDEEENKTKKTVVSQQALTVLRKEPVYASTEYSEAELSAMMKEGNLNEDLMKNVQPGFFTTLQCRTVRVGSYKVQPKERVLISSKGIRLVINSLKNETATIIIPIANILKVLIHFGKTLPVIFIYPLPKVGYQIRSLLGMEDKSGPYYDPASVDDETHKRITILLDKITEDNKITINKIFGQGKLEEITDKEANEILIRASPIEVRNALTMPSDMVRKIMVYPPPPEKGGITLNNQDYACLGEDQFLNDVIIDFYLKYLLLKVLSPEDRNRTHVFSTFFYKRLTTKPKTMRKNDPENDPKLSPAEKRHMRVKGWTKQVNLFEKDFIIVPINEHSHWFLAIICFPGLTGPVKFADNTPVELEEVAPAKKNTQSIQIGSTKITQIIKADGNTLTLEMDSGSDRDEAEGDQDDLHPSSDDEESEQADEESNASQVQIPLLTQLPEQQAPVKETKPKPVKKKTSQEPIKQPCILIFDSLAGASRVRVVATLRDYLKIEYKKKMGEERDFSKDTIKGAVPKVPQQNNFTDCGLYVLQYVESFFQDPLHDFKLPLKYLQDWFPEEVVSSKRQKLASLIRTLMEEQGIKVEEIGLPLLTFTNGNNMDDDQSKMEEEDEEEEEEDDEDDEMNEEEREMLRNRIRLSGFDHNDEEMDLGDEEEDEEDEDFDEEDVEDDDEELVVGGISRRFFVRHRHSSNESESPLKHVGERASVTSGLVDYSSDSEEEENLDTSHNSDATETEQSFNRTDVSEEGKSHRLMEKIKSVPLTELQDFESQISCSTIERNVENRNETGMPMNEGEEEQSGDVLEEEVVHNSKINKSTDKLGQTIERKHSQSNDVLVKENKSVEVTDLLQRLVNDKNITISRKEEESNSNVIKKHLEVHTFKVKDCDKSEVTSPCVSEKNNLASKRSYQDLKSVRIPKKGERQLEMSSKKQKLDER